MSNAIVAEGLGKHFGKVTALDSLDLQVPQGTVMGLQDHLGKDSHHPARPDEGRAEVAGLDVRTHGKELPAKHPPTRVLIRRLNEPMAEADSPTTGEP
jgi:ABC-2 type transport system ATP-binding protein